MRTVSEKRVLGLVPGILLSTVTYLLLPSFVTSPFFSGAIILSRFFKSITRHSVKFATAVAVARLGEDVKKEPSPKYLQRVGSWNTG